MPITRPWPSAKSDPVERHLAVLDRLIALVARHVDSAVVAHPSPMNTPCPPAKLMPNVTTSCTEQVSCRRHRWSVHQCPRADYAPRRRRAEHDLRRPNGDAATQKAQDEIQLMQEARSKKNSARKRREMTVRARARARNKRFQITAIVQCSAAVLKLAVCLVCRRSCRTPLSLLPSFPQFLAKYT